MELKRETQSTAFCRNRRKPYERIEHENGEQCDSGRLLQGRIFAGRLRVAENGIRQDITDIPPARVCISKLAVKVDFAK